MNGRLDFKLIADAEALAGAYVHDKNGLMMAYLGYFELKLEAEFLEAEKALRKFVVERRLEKYHPVVSIVKQVGRLRIDNDMVAWHPPPFS